MPGLQSISCRPMASRCSALSKWHVAAGVGAGAGILIGLVALTGGVFAHLAVKDIKITGFIGKFRLLGDKGALAFLVAGSMVTTGGTLAVFALVYRCFEPNKGASPTGSPSSTPVNYEAVRKEVYTHFKIDESRSEEQQRYALYDAIREKDPPYSHPDRWEKADTKEKLEPLLQSMLLEMRGAFVLSHAALKRATTCSREDLWGLYDSLKLCAFVWHGDWDSECRTGYYNPRYNVRENCVLSICHRYIKKHSDAPEIRQCIEACRAECASLYNTLKEQINSHLAADCAGKSPLRNRMVLRDYGIVQWPSREKLAGDLL